MGVPLGSPIHTIIRGAEIRSSNRRTQVNRKSPITTENQRPKLAKGLDVYLNHPASCMILRFRAELIKTEL